MAVRNDIFEDILLVEEMLTLYYYVENRKIIIIHRKHEISYEYECICKIKKR